MLEFGGGGGYLQRLCTQGLVFLHVHGSNPPAHLQNCQSQILADLFRWRPSYMLRFGGLLARLLRRRSMPDSWDLRLGQMSRGSVQLLWRSQRTSNTIRFKQMALAALKRGPMCTSWYPRNVNLADRLLALKKIGCRFNKPWLDQDLLFSYNVLFSDPHHLLEIFHSTDK